MTVNWAVGKKILSFGKIFLQEDFFLSKLTREIGCQNKLKFTNLTASLGENYGKDQNS